MDTLLPHTREAHRVLLDRLAVAEAAHEAEDPLDAYPPVDVFLTAAARHVAAVLAVLVPAARRKIDHGHELARAFVEQSRRFELALNQVKARLHGSAYAQRRSWASLWSDVRRELEHLWLLEERLAEELVAARVGSDPDWRTVMERVERHVPVRTHPWIPHQGVRAHLVRVYGTDPGRDLRR
ncbi:hypothetical protein [Nocardioides solisilvae]|uniref:hypothetical protein n=1 Tax=Nocardioides solisilvae TaxID=1542435 RepID=UPI000D75019B|nr:hypothetical protein [Nocardioides solisilvae]